MVERLIEAVAAKIKDAWGDEYKVYTESVYQGAKKPCIFVECEKVEKVNLLGDGYFLRAGVLINIDDDRNDKKYRAEALTEELFSLLSKICTQEVTLWGRNIYGKWEKDNFAVRVSYNIFAKREEDEAELMETIDAKQEVE